MTGEKTIDAKRSDDSCLDICIRVCYSVPGFNFVSVKQNYFVAEYEKHMNSRTFATTLLTHPEGVFACYCGRCVVRLKPHSDGGADKEKPCKNFPSKNNIEMRAGSFIHTKGDKYVLLVQSYNRKWGPPKGTVEKGETTYACAIRETYEETGLRIKPAGRRLHPVSHKCGLFNIIVDVPMSVCPMSDEISGYVWARPECISKNYCRLNMSAKLAMSKFVK
jgi:hypothetical protein